MDRKTIHDLKTPLTSLKVYIQILGGKYPDDRKINAYLKKMNAQIDRLTQMIDSLNAS